MNSRERMLAVFNGEKPDRYPAYEHFWDETIRLWKDQGCMPKEAIAEEYFDFDITRYGWEGTDLTAQFDQVFISEDETYKIIKDSRGVVAQYHKKDSGHTPHWLETPIKTPADWWEYKEKLAFNEKRINLKAVEESKKLREQGKFICIHNSDPYEQAWPVFGQVQMFMAMLEEPDIVKDALDTWANLMVECFDYYMAHGLEVDAYFIYGDMGYRNGTLFGPEVYRELIMPAHKRVINCLHDYGKKAILHSCGKIKSFIPMLIESGFDALQPLEAKCDQDMRELLPEFGRQIVFFGNMDIRELSKDRDAIEGEILPKLGAFDGSWNYIFHSDHSIPQTVSFDNYRYSLELVRNYLK